MSDITVTGNKLEFNGKTYDCAIGKKGFARNKLEGDNCTPLGNFPLREILYRADKIPKLRTKLPLQPINHDYGWCDAPTDPDYNRKVKLPYSASHEKLWRDDDIYDVIVIIGYNDSPITPGKGSAIFLHVARPGYEGTEGCVALKLPDLLEVLSNADTHTKIIIRS